MSLEFYGLETIKRKGAHAAQIHNLKYYSNINASVTPPTPYQFASLCLLQTNFKCGLTIS